MSEEKEIKNTETQQSEGTKAATETAKKPKSPKKPSASDEYKRRYFDFYDDIKISDRQDW